MCLYVYVQVRQEQEHRYKSHKSFTIKSASSKVPGECHQFSIFSIINLSHIIFSLNIPTQLSLVCW